MEQQQAPTAAPSHTQIPPEGSSGGSPPGPGTGTGSGFSPGRHLLAALILGLLTLVAWLPAVRVPFVYDDLWEIVGNKALDNLSDLPTILQYNPARALLMLTFAVDRALWGTDPRPYHVENLLIHLFCGFMVYLLAERLLGKGLVNGQPERPKGSGLLEVPAGFAPGLALGAVFICHPLFVEAVTYVASRSSSLTAAFYLAAFYCWVRFRDTQAQGASRTVTFGWFFFTLNLYLLSILTKEEGVSLPAVLLAYDLLLAPRPGSAKASEASMPTSNDASQRLRTTLRWLGALVPFGVLLLLLVLGRMLFYGTLMPPVIVRTPWQSLMTSFEVLWVYWRLLVAPYGLSLYHDYPVVMAFGQPLTWLAMTGHLALMGLGWRLRKSFPLLMFALIWYYASLSPTTSFIPLKEVMAEHRMYLAAFGPMLLLGVGLVWLRDRWKVPALALGLPLSLLLGFFTFKTNVLWQDDLSLWQRAVDLNPASGDAWYALGDAFKRRRNPEEAIKAYRQAIDNYKRLNVDLSAYTYSYVDALHNLGVVYGQKGDLGQAMVYIRRALTTRPSYVPGWNSLGFAQMSKGLTQEAVLSFEEAVRLDPNSWLAHYHLGTLYSGKELDPDKAALHFKRCLELEPNHKLNEQIRSKLLELGYQPVQ